MEIGICHTGFGNLFYIAYCRNYYNRNMTGSGVCLYLLAKLFAVGIAVILGAVFYGLNNSSIKEATTAPPATTAQNAAPTSPPAAPPGMRDVTPRANTQPGMTTGANPADPKPLSPRSADPKAPPAPAPSGATE